MKKTRNSKVSTRLATVMIAIMMAGAFAVCDTVQVAGAVGQINAQSISTTSTVAVGNNTVTLTGCVKGKEYVLAVVKGSYKNYTVTDEAIQYIDQKTAQGSDLKFSFPIKGSERVVVLVSSNDGAADYPIMIGEANIPIGEATVTMVNRTYNGASQQAAISNVTYRGKQYSVGTVCTVSGAGTNVGTYYATVTGKGSFVGTIYGKYNINPVGTSLKKVKKGKKSMTVKWKKPKKKYKKQMTGYQIQYSLNANFNDARIVSGGGYKKTSKKIKGLQAKKRYYVRVRTYKGECYSSWSNVKSVVTK